MKSLSRAIFNGRPCLAERAANGSTLLSARAAAEDAFALENAERGTSCATPFALLRRELGERS